MCVLKNHEFKTNFCFKKCLGSKKFLFQKILISKKVLVQNRYDIKKWIFQLLGQTTNLQSVAEFWPATLLIWPHLCVLIIRCPTRKEYKENFANPVEDIVASSQVGVLTMIVDMFGRGCSLSKKQNINFANIDIF